MQFGTSNGFYGYRGSTSPIDADPFHPHNRSKVINYSGTVRVWFSCFRSVQVFVLQNSAVTVVDFPGKPVVGDPPT